MRSDMIEAMAKRVFAMRMEREGADHMTWTWRYETQRPELLLDAQAALAAIEAAGWAVVPVDVLSEAQEVLELAARVPIADPNIREAVAKIGDWHGYGNLMATASVLWREKLGEQKGGEFVNGPCRITVERTLAMLAAARGGA